MFLNGDTKVVEKNESTGGNHIYLLAIELETFRSTNPLITHLCLPHALVKTIKNYDSYMLTLHCVFSRTFGGLAPLPSQGG